MVVNMGVEQGDHPAPRTLHVHYCDSVDLDLVGALATILISTGIPYEYPRPNSDAAPHVSRPNCPAFHSVISGGMPGWLPSRRSKNSEFRIRIRIRNCRRESPVQSCTSTGMFGLCECDRFGTPPKRFGGATTAFLPPRRDLRAH